MPSHTTGDKSIQDLPNWTYLHPTDRQPCTEVVAAIQIQSTSLNPTPLNQSDSQDVNT